MSEPQKVVKQVFKKFEVIRANTAEQISMNVTAMLLLGVGWQLYGPTMAVPMDDGIEYFQSLLMYEYVTEDAPMLVPASEQENQGE